MKIAVIGAGAGGLAATKICREYGFDVTCFEQLDSIGGLWHYKPKSVPGQASIAKTTTVNSSKEFMAYSDFPPPADLPNFMHHSHVLAYFEMYAEHFSLKSFIKFETEVKFVKRNENYEKSGQWDVTYCVDSRTGTETTSTFDSIIIANGHHAYPFWPNFEGLEKFNGRLIHSHSYKEPCSFLDKRVLVIGVGNSGGDVAVELGHLASQVYLSTRRGFWCQSRLIFFGFPADFFVQSRLFYWMLHNFFSLTNSIIEWYANTRFSHALYGIKCKHRIYSQQPTVNDSLPHRMMSGAIKIKPNVRRFLDENGVEFDDGSKIYGLDDVIMCTGYNVSFPMLEKCAIDVEENVVELYKLMYPPQMDKHPTMCVIGLVQPLGGIMPIAEMQARFHCESLMKRITLPSRTEMLDEIRRRNDRMRRRFGGARRHTVQVDYAPYMDDLASNFGAKPSIWRHLVIERDWSLAARLVVGPTFPYHYRLQGPHKWDGARDAIMTAWHRTLAPIRSGGWRRPSDEKLISNCRKNLRQFLVTVAFFVLIFWLLMF